jgi:hypothetical protein
MDSLLSYFLIPFQRMRFSPDPDLRLGEAAVESVAKFKGG